MHLDAGDFRPFAQVVLEQQPVIGRSARHNGDAPEVRLVFDGPDQRCAHGRMAHAGADDQQIASLQRLVGQGHAERPAQAHHIPDLQVVHGRGDLADLFDVEGEGILHAVAERHGNGDFPRAEHGQHEKLAAQGGAALIGAVAVADRKPLDALGFLKNIDDLRYERRIRLRVEQAFLALVVHVDRRGGSFQHLVGRPFLHPGHDVHHIDGCRADGRTPPASGTALHAEALFDILQLVVDPVAHSRSLGARVMEFRVPGERYRLARVPDPDAGAGMGRVLLLFGGETGTGGANARASGTGDAA